MKFIGKYALIPFMLPIYGFILLVHEVSKLDRFYKGEQFQEGTRFLLLDLFASYTDGHLVAAAFIWIIIQVFSFILLLFGFIQTLIIQVFSFILLFGFIQTL